LGDQFYLSLAVDEAWKYQLLTYPNPAVGCAIVDEHGALLALEAHREAGGAHAELAAARSAILRLAPDMSLPDEPNALHKFVCQNHRNLLKNCTYYVTLEPCAHQGRTPSCARLIAQLGAGRVVIGVRDAGEIEGGGAQILDEGGVRVEWADGLIKERCEELLAPFAAWQRDRFVYLKLAQRLDGSYDGGTITCDESRAYVHALRDKCDLIIIGGETVRTDRPVLDARLVGGHAPDVLIVTRSDVPRDAPLFGVGGRKVIVQNSLEIPSGYKHIMIEGGAGLMEAYASVIDMVLLFESSSFSRGGTKNIKVDMSLKPLYESFIKTDKICWYSQKKA
jgi:diaminohydroxyphosphoribosylaminopyrimidine deaminase/5-amino-6-(5-phosphoribosylamino)uracil reductase